MKALIVLLFSICFALPADAQLYFELYSGYAFSQSPIKQRNINEYDFIREELYFRTKVGKGLNLGFAIGNNFSDNFGAEIQFSTKFFTKSEFTFDFPASTFGPTYSSGIFGTTSVWSNTLQFSPLFCFTVPKSRVSPFIKIGPAFLLASTTEANEYDKHETKLKLTGGVSVGVHMNIGFNYNYSERICFYSEASIINLNYYYRQSEMIERIIDGVDKLDELEQTTYKAEGDEGKVNHSSIGFNFGVKYLLSKN